MVMFTEEILNGKLHFFVQCLPTSVTKRKRPTQKILQVDEISSFPDQDIFDDLNKNYAPTEFIFSKNQDCAFYYNLHFNQYSQCSKFIMTIKIDKKLHVSSTGPSSPMVCSMKKVNLTRFSPLLNFLLLNFLSQLKIYVISSIEAITQRIFIPCVTSIKSTMWVLVL